MLPTSRWFLLIAGAALVAMAMLAFVGDRLELTTVPGSPEALRLASFMRAAHFNLFLLFGFAMVPPAVRLALGAFARRRAGARHAPASRAEGAPRPRLADMLTLGIWAVCALGLAVAAGPLLAALRGG
jgi:hypothetical protein